MSFTSRREDLRSTASITLWKQMSYVHVFRIMKVWFNCYICFRWLYDLTMQTSGSGMTISIPQPYDFKLFIKSKMSCRYIWSFQTSERLSQQKSRPNVKLQFVLHSKNHLLGWGLKQMRATCLPPVLGEVLDPLEACNKLEWDEPLLVAPYVLQQELVPRDVGIGKVELNLGRYETHM